MKRDEIYKIAVNCELWDYFECQESNNDIDHLEEFAAAIEARTREECAVIAENRSTADGYEIAHNIRALP